MNSRRQIPPTAAEERLKNIKNLKSSGSLYFKDIHYQTWYPVNAIENVHLVYIHGLNSYGARFSVHGEKLMSMGYRVTVMDLSGFGRSDGLHSYTDSRNVDRWVEDVHTILSLVNDGTPIFLFAVSMGGLVALNYSLKYRDVKGMILVAPLIRLEKMPSWWFVWIVNLLPNWLLEMPWLHKGREDVYSTLDHQLDFNNDRLCYHGRMRIGTGLSLTSSIMKINRKFNQVNVPFLILHGDNDSSVDIKGALELADVAGGDIHVFEGYGHDLLCFADALHVFDLVNNWIKNK